jgi:hypothetical protein
MCSKGCGRKFAPDRLKKHEKICVKVFQKKRKTFNATEKRSDKEALKHARNAKYSGGGGYNKSKKGRGGRNKAAKWK